MLDTWSRSTKRALLFAAIVMTAASSFAGSITYHGRLLKSDGTPVVADPVKFRISLRSPGSENCLMYQETQAVDMSASNGIFSVSVNDGSAIVINTEPFSLDRVFQNRGTFSFAGGKCVIGNSYSPQPADGRKIVVEFDDGMTGGWEPLPAQAINFVPMAMESLTVGGYGSGSMLRVNDGTGAPASISALTQAQYTSLMDLIAGTSASYLSSSSSLNGANLSAGSIPDAALASGISASKISGNISGNAAGFSGSLAGDVTGTQGATVVAKLQGRAVDTATPSNGQVLTWNNSNSRWEPANPSASGTVTSVTASAPLASSGGATPNLTIAQASTSANGYLSSTDWNTFNGKGSVSSVGFTAPSIFSVSGAPVTTSGTIALSLASQSANTVFAGPVSGSAAPTFRALNINDIRSTNTGSFLTGTTCSAGQALVYSAVSDTVSCASISLTSSQVTTALGAASTSANGYLTSTDWNTFNGKQAALGFTPVNKAGDTMSGGLTLPSNGLVVGTNQLVASGGNVGVGTATPGVQLDVNGAVRAGSSTTVTTCGLGAANGEGSQRYNYTSHSMEFCNGTTWTPVGGSTSANTCIKFIYSSATFTMTTSATLTYQLIGGGGGGSGGNPGNGWAAGGGGGGGSSAILKNSVLIASANGGAGGNGVMTSVGNPGADGQTVGGSVSVVSGDVIKVYAGGGGGGGCSNGPGAGGSGYYGGGGGGYPNNSPAGPNGTGGGGGTGTAGGAAGTSYYVGAAVAGAGSLGAGGNSGSYAGTALGGTGANGGTSSYAGGGGGGYGSNGATNGGTGGSNGSAESSTSPAAGHPGTGVGGPATAACNAGGAGGIGILTYSSANCTL